MNAYIAVGSNILPKENIKKALLLLKEETYVKKISTFYVTKAIGNDKAADYLNGVFEIESFANPEVIKKEILQKIENKLGRKRNADKYSSRTIDLDIILYDDIVIKNNFLTIPSHDVYERFFVAVPLAEINPGIILPDTGKNILSIAESFDNISMQAERDFTIELKKLIGEDVK